VSNWNEETVAKSSLRAEVSWDYTEHASHYDKRADYSADAIEDLLKAIGCSPPKNVADIGAGTGKLTKELLKHGLSIRSVEPNDAMREIGIRNTAGQSVHWSAGTGEHTGLPSRSAHAVFFGSSFNVVDQGLALAEAARVLLPKGWFACMWNHRDLNDPVQQEIENIIKSFVPGYSYGARREDPTATITASGFFSDVQSLARSFAWDMPRTDIIVAWKSHATLRRQASSHAVFDSVIAAIATYLESLPEIISVPYTTRVFFAQLRS
jgi:ubiquinone/menaquinone biosynthesis C-methylase UbiE